MFIFYYHSIGFTVKANIRKYNTLLLIYALSGGTANIGQVKHGSSCQVHLALYYRGGQYTVDGWCKIRIIRTTLPSLPSLILSWGPVHSGFGRLVVAPWHVMAVELGIDA